MTSVGRTAKEMLNGPTRTVYFYEGTNTSQVPFTGTGANRVVAQDAYQPSAGLQTGWLVKNYTTTERWYQKMAASDDGALIRGMITGEVTRDPANDESWGNVQFFQDGDYIKMECDATHSAIAEGDPISIDAVDTWMSGTAHRHGVTVDLAGAGDTGFGYAHNALAANTAGFIVVEYYQPQYEYIRGGVNGNITTDIFPLGFADFSGKIVGVRHVAASQSAAGAFNITCDGDDIKSTSDWATVTTAAWASPDQNTDVVAGDEILLDVSDAGTTVADFAVTVKILKDRVA